MALGWKFSLGVISVKKTWHATREDEWLGVVRERDSAVTCRERTGVIYELLVLAKIKMLR